MSSLLAGLAGPFLLETTLWGLFFPLFALAVWILVFDKGLAARADACMLVAITLMYFVSSVHWTMNLVFIRALVSPHQIPTVKTWNSVQAAMLAINFVIGDAIVIWRACLLWEENIFVVAGLGVLLLSTLGLSIANVVMIRPDIAAVATELRFTIGHVGTTAIALSLASNVCATALVAFKSWRLRNRLRTFLKQGNRKTLLEKVMSLLVESGAIYSCLWILFIISNVSDALGAFTPFIAEGMGQLTGIYPTVIIVLVCFQKTHFERQFKYMPSSTPTPTPASRFLDKGKTENSQGSSWGQYDVPLYSPPARDSETAPMIPASARVEKPAAARRVALDVESRYVSYWEDALVAQPGYTLGLSGSV